MFWFWTYSRPNPRNSHWVKGICSNASLCQLLSWYIQRMQLQKFDKYLMFTVDRVQTTRQFCANYLHFKKFGYRNVYQLRIYSYIFTRECCQSNSHLLLESSGITFTIEFLITIMYYSYSLKKSITIGPPLAQHVRYHIRSRTTYVLWYFIYYILRYLVTVLDKGYVYTSLVSTRL